MIYLFFGTELLFSCSHIADQNELIRMMIACVVCCCCCCCRISAFCMAQARYKWRITSTRTSLLLLLYVDSSTLLTCMRAQHSTLETLSFSFCHALLYSKSKRFHSLFVSALCERVCKCVRLYVHTKHKIMWCDVMWWVGAQISYQILSFL